VAISRRRRVAALLLSLALFSALGTLVFELGLRLLVPVTDRYVYMYDPILGPRPAPNQSGEYLRGDYVHGAFHFNAQGWNHPRDYSPARKPGTKRICLVGDSQVESLQVRPELTHFSVAERAMSRPDRPVEWYAFGVSGWGTNMHYETIRHYALDYRPDVVVLLFVQNDPFDGSPYIVDPGSYRPLYYLDPGGELVLVQPVYYERPIYRPRFFTHLALVRYLVHQKLIVARLTQVDRRGVGGLPLMADGAAPRHVAIPGIESMSRREREARTWQLVEAILRAARDECARRGAVFAVAFRGWMFEIDAPVTGETLTPPPRSEDPFCLGSRVSEMGREQVGPIAERLGIPYLDLTDALRDEVAKSGESHVFPDDLHYNARAHARAGSELAAWAETLLARAGARSDGAAQRP
jgi:hypothetical protein